MRSKIHSILLLAAVFVAAPGTAAPCNVGAAIDVGIGLREFAKSRVEGDHLAVHWTYKIEKLSDAERLKMVTAYANMDACLYGGAREIHFYRKERVMAVASPQAGIRLVK